MGFRMAGGGCCCDACKYLADPFDAAPDARWSEEVGTWSQASGYVTGTSGARLIVATDNPDESVISYQAATVHLHADNDEAFLIADWVDDDNFLFGRYYLDADGFVTTQVGKVVGGTRTNLGAAQGAGLSIVDGDITCRLCFNGERLTADFSLPTSPNPDQRYASTVSISGSSGRVGIGVGDLGSGGSVKFLDYTWSRSAESAGGATCPGCINPCSTCIPGTVPFGILIEIEGAVNKGDCGAADYFNNTAFVLRPGAFPFGFESCQFGLRLPGYQSVAGVGDVGDAALCYYHSIATRLCTSTIAFGHQYKWLLDIIGGTPAPAATSFRSRFLDTAVECVTAGGAPTDGGTDCNDVMIHTGTYQQSFYQVGGIDQGVDFSGATVTMTPLYLAP
jgi:hypothetical protein